MNFPFILKNYRHWIKRLVHRKSGGMVSVGQYTYGAPLVRWWGEDANLSIGRFCSIADDVEIFLGGNHRTDWVSTYPFPVMREWSEAGKLKGHPASKGDVLIGNDVWLGSGCVILSGITVGHGAVVGCRSVVTQDVPDYAIVAGNPAVVMRMRFAPDAITKLVESAWWDWPPERVRNSVPLLSSTDLEGFFDAAKRG